MESAHKGYFQKIRNCKKYEVTLKIAFSNQLLLPLSLSLSLLSFESRMEKSYSSRSPGSLPLMSLSPSLSSDGDAGSGALAACTRAQSER